MTSTGLAFSNKILSTITIPCQNLAWSGSSAKIAKMLHITFLQLHKPDLCIIYTDIGWAKFGGLWFLPATHVKAIAKQMRSRSLRAARLLACDCFHAQPAVHAINLRTW